METQETQEHETVVFQKNRYKILTYINPFEQNNDHTRISHEIEFRSSFKNSWKQKTNSTKTLKF